MHTNKTPGYFDKPYHHMIKFDEKKIADLFIRINKMDCNDIKQFTLIESIPLTVTNNDGNNLIHMVLLNDDNKSELQRLNMIRYLYIENVNPGAPNNNNVTPLHIACKKQFKTLVEFLLDKCVDVNYTDNNGSTPFHYLLAGKIRLEEKQEKSIQSLIIPKQKKIDKEYITKWTTARSIIWSKIKESPYLKAISNTIKYTMLYNDDGLNTIRDFQDDWYKLNTKEYGISKMDVVKEMKILRDSSLSKFKNQIEKKWKLATINDIVIHETTQNSWPHGTDAVDNLSVIKNANIQEYIKSELDKSILKLNNINELVSIPEDIDINENYNEIKEKYDKKNTDYYNLRNINEYNEYKTPNAIDFASDIIDWDKYIFIGGSRQIQIICELTKDDLQFVFSVQNNLNRLVYIMSYSLKLTTNTRTDFTNDTNGINWENITVNQLLNIQSEPSSDLSSDLHKSYLQHVIIIYIYKFILDELDFDFENMLIDLITKSNPKYIYLIELIKLRTESSYKASWLYTFAITFQSIYYGNTKTPIPINQLFIFLIAAFANCKSDHLELSIHQVMKPLLINLFLQRSAPLNVSNIYAHSIYILLNDSVDYTIDNDVVQYNEHNLDNTKLSDIMIFTKAFFNNEEFKNISWLNISDKIYNKLLPSEILCLMIITYYNDMPQKPLLQNIVDIINLIKYKSIHASSNCEIVNQHMINRLFTIYEKPVDANAVKDTTSLHAYIDNVLPQILTQNKNDHKCLFKLLNIKDDESIELFLLTEYCMPSKINFYLSRGYGYVNTVSIQDLSEKIHYLLKKIEASHLGLCFMGLLPNILIPEYSDKYIESIGTCFPQGTIITDKTIINQNTLFTSGTFIPNDTELPDTIELPENTILPQGTLIKNDTCFPSKVIPLTLYKDTLIPGNITFKEGTIIPPTCVFPEGTFIGPGTVITTGTVFPDGTVIPVGTIIPYGVEWPRRAIYPDKSIKFPTGTYIPLNAVFPPNTFIEPDTCIAYMQLPLDEFTAFPKGTIITNNTCIKAGTCWETTNGVYLDDVSSYINDIAEVIDETYICNKFFKCDNAILTEMIKRDKENIPTLFQTALEKFTRIASGIQMIEDTGIVLKSISDFITQCAHSAYNDTFAEVKVIEALINKIELISLQNNMTTYLLVKQYISQFKITYTDQLATIKTNVFNDEPVIKNNLDKMNQLHILTQQYIVLINNEVFFLLPQVQLEKNQITTCMQLLMQAQDRLDNYSMSAIEIVKNASYARHIAMFTIKEIEKVSIVLLNMNEIFDILKQKKNASNANNLIEVNQKLDNIKLKIIDSFDLQRIATIIDYTYNIINTAVSNIIIRVPLGPPIVNVTIHTHASIHLLSHLTNCAKNINSVVQYINIHRINFKIIIEAQNNLAKNIIAKTISTLFNILQEFFVNKNNLYIKNIIGINDNIFTEITKELNKIMQNNRWLMPITFPNILTTVKNEFETKYTNIESKMQLIKQFIDTTNILTNTNERIAPLNIIQFINNATTSINTAGTHLTDVSIYLQTIEYLKDTLKNVNLAVNIETIDYMLNFAKAVHSININRNSLINRETLIKKQDYLDKQDIHAVYPPIKPDSLIIERRDNNRFSVGTTIKLATNTVLPDGTKIPFGTNISINTLLSPNNTPVKFSKGSTIAKGTTFPTDTTISEGTYIPLGTILNIGSCLPLGTNIQKCQFPVNTVLTNLTCLPKGTKIDRTNKSSIKITKKNLQALQLTNGNIGIESVLKRDFIFSLESELIETTVFTTGSFFSKTLIIEPPSSYKTTLDNSNYSLFFYFNYHANIQNTQNINIPYFYTYSIPTLFRPPTNFSYKFLLNTICIKLIKLQNKLTKIMTKMIKDFQVKSKSSTYGSVISYCYPGLLAINSHIKVINNIIDNSKDLLNLKIKEFKINDFEIHVNSINTKLYLSYYLNSSNIVEIPKFIYNQLGQGVIIFDNTDQNLNYFNTTTNVSNIDESNIDESNTDVIRDTKISSINNISSYQNVITEIKKGEYFKNIHIYKSFIISKSTRLPPSFDNQEALSLFYTLNTIQLIVNNGINLVSNIDNSLLRGTYNKNNQTQKLFIVAKMIEELIKMYLENKIYEIGLVIYNTVIKKQNNNTANDYDTELLFDIKYNFDIDINKNPSNELITLINTHHTLQKILINYSPFTKINTDIKSNIFYIYPNDYNGTNLLKSKYSITIDEELIKLIARKGDIFIHNNEMASPVTYLIKNTYYESLAILANEYKPSLYYRYDANESPFIYLLEQYKNHVKKFINGSNMSEYIKNFVQPQFDEIKNIIQANDVYNNNILVNLELSFSICNYLCQQYLINYMATNSNIMQSENLRDIPYIKFIINEDIKITDNNYACIFESLIKQNKINLKINYISTDKLNDIQSFTNIDIISEYDNLLNLLDPTDTLRVSYIDGWKQLLKLDLSSDLLISSILQTENKNNNSDITDMANIITENIEYYEFMHTFVKTYFEKSFYKTDNKILVFIYNMLIHLTQNILCNSIELIIQKILFQSIEQTNIITDTDLNSIQKIMTRVEYIMTDEIKKYLYKEVAIKLVINSVNIFNDIEEKESHETQSTGEILNLFLELLVSSSPIKLHDNTLNILKNNIIPYFDTIVNRTINNWAVCCENMFLYLINHYRLLKTIQVLLPT